MSVQPENGRVGGQPTQTADYLLAEARKHRASLERLIMQFETAPHQIAAVDGSQRQTRKMQDFPVQGVNRYIVPKSGFGGLVTLVAAANTALLPINEARLGLQIINTGSAAVTIYLGAIGEIGVRALPQLWLGAAAALGRPAQRNGLVREHLRGRCDRRNHSHDRGDLMVINPPAAATQPAATSPRQTPRYPVPSGVGHALITCLGGGGGGGARQARPRRTQTAGWRDRAAAARHPV